jgi:uncharacterized membrane protein
VEKIKKYYLAFSAVARTYLDVASLDADFAHILGAVMGLYLALGLFWLYAACEHAYSDAIVMTIFCYASLVSGRLLLHLITAGRRRCGCLRDDRACARSTRTSRPEAARLNWTTKQGTLDA